jgi:hypothetical protein
MKLPALPFQICLKALSPAHGCIYSPRGDAILRTPYLAILLAPFLFRKERQQVLFERHDRNRLERLVESQSIKLFDDDEQLSQDRPASRQDAVPGLLHATKPTRMLAEIMLEKLAEMLFQFRYPMGNVPLCNPFDLGRASYGFHRMNEALIDERDPKEDVGHSDRMVTAFARFRAARGCGRTLYASRLLRLRGLGLLPHPGGMLEAESEQEANESLKSALERIRNANLDELDGRSEESQGDVMACAGPRKARFKRLMSTADASAGNDPQ